MILLPNTRDDKTPSYKRIDIDFKNDDNIAGGDNLLSGIEAKLVGREINGFQIKNVRSAGITLPPNHRFEIALVSLQSNLYIEIYRLHYTRRILISKTLVIESDTQFKLMENYPALIIEDYINTNLGTKTE